jgi:hypothetical protein
MSTFTIIDKCTFVSTQNRLFQDGAVFGWCCCFSAQVSPGTSPPCQLYAETLGKRSKRDMPDHLSKVETNYEFNFFIASLNCMCFCCSDRSNTNCGINKSLPVFPCTFTPRLGSDCSRLVQKRQMRRKIVKGRPLRLKSLKVWSASPH